MDAGLLADLTSLPALSRLIEALGHPPVWEDLPPAAVPLPVDAAAVVGRAGHFEWLAVRGPGGADLARRLSAALAARGRTAGVLALDAEARLLGIAVTVDRPAACVVSLAQPAPADLERLRRLAGSASEDGVRYALRAAATLSGEDAGRRFFRAFRAAVDAMADGVSGAQSESDRRALALVQLTRVLFLYFVQAKGWLDGRADFLRQAVDGTLARRRRLHRDLFRPLFFGTLNRPREARGRSRAFGRIPFLNGGLFEPHPLERSWRGDIPDRAWRAAFDDVFEHFHFTASEGGEPGSIAPDMLGRVFEGLMAPADRRASGAFYTPARLVARVVDAGLRAFVGRRLDLDPAEAAARLERRAPEALAALRDITILDPAAGSGAFLLGALERLAALLAGDAPPAALRRRILEHNLFGVDANPMAVRLAELRLWLSVIAADGTADPDQVAPLPNLDGVVRQGDSLLDAGWFLAGLGVRPERHGPELRELRAALVRSAGAPKRELLRRVRQAEVRAFEECLARAEELTEGEVARTLAAARSTDLFGRRRGVDHELRGELTRQRSRLREIRRLHRRLGREGMVPWFQYECHFADVAARGGFDLVLGNPPWVRAEQLPPETRRRLARRYRWWRGLGRGFAHQPDLAVAFLERGVELLAPGGATALLLPAKLATAGYATRLRAELAERHTLEVLADLGDDPAARFEATTYPAALVIVKGPAAPRHTVALGLDLPRRASLPQRRLQGGSSWILTAPDLLDATHAVSRAHPRLGDRFTPQLGVKTGANAVFLEPPATLEPTLVRLALRGRDVRPFSPHARLRLFFPHDAAGAVFARLPPHAAGYAAAQQAVLRARVDYQGGPVWSLFRVRAAVAPHRVVWADLARRLTALPLMGHGIVPLNTCYVLPVPDRRTALALSAWLNCTWLRAAARAVADPASGGFARFNARVVAGLPLPPAVLDDARLVRLAERGAAGEAVQEELDAIAAEHLSLSPRARAVLASAAGAGPDDRRRSAGRGR